MQFDQDLLPDGPALANFAVTHLLEDRILTDVQIAGDVLQIAGTPAGILTGPNGISYFAAPPQLFGLTGQPVPPFLRIPFI